MTIFENFILIINEFINIRIKQIEIYKESNNIKEIRSHPFAIEQCQSFLSSLNVSIKQSVDTAGIDFLLIFLILTYLQLVISL